MLYYGKLIEVCDEDDLSLIEDGYLGRSSVLVAFFMPISKLLIRDTAKDD
jgi:hypothetical protein